MAGEPMIDRFRQHAERLRFLRPFFAVLGVVGLGVAAIEIFGPGIGEQDYLAPALVLMLWSLVAFAAIGLFQDVPPPAQDDAGFIARVGRRLARGFFYLLAVAFIALTVTGLLMTYRLISLQA